MLHITHTRADGTLIDGITTGDGTVQILQAQWWRFSQRLGQWYMPLSRNTAGDRTWITRTVAALQSAGHEVDVELDDTPRPVADVEADRAERQDIRAQRLAAQAQRAQEAAQAAEAAMQAAAERLPPGGEPVKIGHHSEGRHQRAIERAHRTLEESAQADRRAREAAAAARAAAATTSARYAPETVANRLAKLEAEHRSLLRRRDGHTRTLDARTRAVEITPPAVGEYRDHLEETIRETLEQITHWQAVRDQQQADGAATAYSAQSVRPGDSVRINGRWRRVVRANTKTVTVTTDHSWSDRAPWHAVQAHKAAE